MNMELILTAFFVLIIFVCVLFIIYQSIYFQGNLWGILELFTAKRFKGTVIEVKFPDEKLEDKIKEDLKKWDGGPLTNEILFHVEKLWLAGAKINDITGMEYLVNLKEVNLSDNRVKDFSPIKHVGHVTGEEEQEFDREGENS